MSEEEAPTPEPPAPQVDAQGKSTKPTPPDPPRPLKNHLKMKRLNAALGDPVEDQDEIDPWFHTVPAFFDEAVTNNVHNQSEARKFSALINQRVDHCKVMVEGLIELMGFTMVTDHKELNFGRYKVLCDLGSEDYPDLRLMVTYDTGISGVGDVQESTVRHPMSGTVMLYRFNGIKFESESMWDGIKPLQNPIQFTLMASKEAVKNEVVRLSRRLFQTIALLESRDGKPLQ